jgi:hypothetical protein
LANVDAFSDIEVGGAPSITVGTVTEATQTPTPTSTPDPSVPSASRSFPAASVAPGGDVVVTITAAGHGSFGEVKETLPAGFTYGSSSLPDDEVEVDGQSVTFSLLGTSTFTYTVTASSEEGEHSFTGVFSGVLANVDAFSDIEVGGAPSITVGTVTEATQTPTPTSTPDPSAPSASRSFSADSVAPDADVMVTITVAGHGSFVDVKETLPLGFTYVSSSLNDDEVEVEGQTVTFTLLGKTPPTTFTYTCPLGSLMYPAS